MHGNLTPAFFPLEQHKEGKEPKDMLATAALFVKLDSAKKLPVRASCMQRNAKEDVSLFPHFLANMHIIPVLPNV